MTTMTEGSVGLPGYQVPLAGSVGFTVNCGTLAQSMLNWIGILYVHVMFFGRSGGGHLLKGPLARGRPLNQARHSSTC